ncbi:MAG: hypothetical protein ACPGWM_08720, partial [Flavobacteriales bacterium]
KNNKMKKSLLPFIFGFVLCAILSLLFRQNSTPEEQTNNQKELMLPENNEALTVIEKISEAEAIHWIKKFQHSNYISKGKFKYSPEIQPINAGDCAQHDGYNYTKKLSSWHLSLDELKTVLESFEDAESLFDEEKYGLRFYPALKPQRVYRPNGTTFVHEGMTLVISPTKAVKTGDQLVYNNIIDPNPKCGEKPEILAFDYVDPCPNLCPDENTDLDKTDDVNGPGCSSCFQCGDEGSDTCDCLDWETCQKP